MFRKAVKKKAKLRLGIVGAAGSGKSYSSLLIAKGLGGKIAVIDTENGSADLYADIADFDVDTLKAPYSIDKYINAIKEAENLGYNTIIIDSLSHAWAGDGGLLDQQGRIADSGKNGFSAWRSITPLHNKLIETILNSDCHIIATMRAKTDYILQENDRGKQMPVKVGLAPVQREGMDYEFTVVFDIDTKHNAVCSKDRTSLFNGMIFTPSEETGQLLLKWLEDGVEVKYASDEQLKRLDDLGVNKISLCRYYQISSIQKLTEEMAADAIKEKEEQIERRKPENITNDYIPNFGAQ